MNGTAIPLDHWADVMLNATAEVATVSLACEGLNRHEGAPQPAEPYGAYLPVIADEEKLHLGLLASEESCRSLTRLLFGMEPDEDPPIEDVADAVGEIVNIFAGIMQRDMVGEVKSFDLGLPIFVSGEIIQHRGLSSSRINVGFDDIRAQLVVLGHEGD